VQPAARELDPMGVAKVKCRRWMAVASALLLSKALSARAAELDSIAL